MPYSSQSHTTANASTTSFSYSDVPLLADVPHKDQLKVYENGQLRTFNVTGADNYTLNTTSELVVFNSARASGVTIKIARSTDIENKEITFTNSSVLTAQDLNKNSDQLLFLCQELYDKAQDISLTAVGTVPPNSIGSSQLISDAGDEAVTSSVIRDGAVTTAKIDDGAVTAVKIDDGAVETAKIQDLNVTTGKINNLAVTAEKIDNLAVTTGKIADNAVNLSKININVPIVRTDTGNTWPVGAIYPVGTNLGVGFTVPNPGASGSSNWFISAIAYTAGGIIGGRLIGYSPGGTFHTNPGGNTYWTGFAIRVS